MNTPEQAAAIDNVAAAIQQALAVWPAIDNADDTDLVIIEWVIVAATERISGPRLDPDGDNISEYFNLHSPHISNHAARGLLLQAIDRLTP